MKSVTFCNEVAHSLQLGREPTTGDREVLEYLGTHCGRWTEEGELARHLLGDARGGSTMKMRLGRLRDRLGPVIENEYGWGYRLARCLPQALFASCPRCGRRVVLYTFEAACHACGWSGTETVAPGFIAAREVNGNRLSYDEWKTVDYLFVNTFDGEQVPPEEIAEMLAGERQRQLGEDLQGLTRRGIVELKGEAVRLVMAR